MQSNTYYILPFNDHTWAVSLRSCFSTINWPNDVNKTIHTNIYHGTQPRDGIKYFMPSCIKFIYILNKLHHIFEFKNDMMCLNGVYILRQYKIIIDYIHNIPNDSTRRVQKTNVNPIKCIKCIYRVQCLKQHRCYRYQTI